MEANARLKLSADGEPMRADRAGSAVKRFDDHTTTSSRGGDMNGSEIPGN